MSGIDNALLACCRSDRPVSAIKPCIFFTDHMMQWLTPVVHSNINTLGLSLSADVWVYAHSSNKLELLMKDFTYNEGHV